MLFVNFLEKGKGAEAECFQVQLERTDYTVLELAYMLRAYRPEAASITLHLDPAEPPLTGGRTLAELDLLNDSVFALWETVRPIETKVKELKDVLDFIPLTKYSFCDEDKAVKVYIDLPGVGALKAEQVERRFLQRSLQVKVLDLQGKNYLFAVPRTQCKLDPAKSKVIVKANSLVVSIGKVDKSDNWFSVYKAKTVGGTDDD